MRILFADETVSDESERHVRARACEHADAIARELARSAANAREVQAAIAEHVRAIDDRIEVELSVDGMRTLILSVRGERTLNNLIAFVAERVRERAPDDVSIVTQRPPAPLSRAIEDVRSSLEIDISDARVRAGFARGHLIELALYSSAFGSSQDERALEAAEIAVVSLLGERVFDDWIGDIRVAPLSRRSSLPVLGASKKDADTHPLGELPDLIGAAVRGLLDGLPALPIWRRSDGASEQTSADWTMFELEPELQHDYVAQDDLAIATTREPELLKCFLRHQPFSCVRFSRSGERFCYLKLDGDGERAEPRLSKRRALEDALGEALPRAGAGAVIGSGLGVRYTYVNLALANLNDAVMRVLELARGAGVPERSWLLFCDGDLANEWVGVWPNAPPPLLERG